MIAGWAANLLVLIVAVMIGVAAYAWLRGAELDEEQPLPPDPRPSTVRVLRPPYDQDHEEGA
jgi:hypothetical protein